MGRIRDGHIGYLEAIALVVILNTTDIFRALPKEMLKAGLGAAWMIPLIATILAVVAFYFLDKLMKEFPEKTIVQVSEEIVGPYLGTICSLVIFGMLFYPIPFILRQIIEVIKTVVLPLTPISVLIALYVLTSAYCVYQGIETMSRGIWLFAPPMLFATVLIIIAVYPWFNTYALFPIFGPGIGKIATISIQKVSIFASLILLGVLFPSIRNSKKFLRIGSLGIIISGMITSAVVMTWQITFPDRTGMVDGIAPLYQVARLIFFGRFVERLEPIFILLWVFAALFRVSLLFYGSCLTLAETLKLPTYRPLVYPMALLLFTFSLLPKNLVADEHIITDVIRSYDGLILLLPIMLLAVKWVKNKFKKEALTIK